MHLERKISCKTYLKRLHVTNRMAELLLPEQSAAAVAPGALSQHYTLLFKTPIMLVDHGGQGGRACLSCRLPWRRGRPGGAGLVLVLAWRGGGLRRRLAWP